MLGRMRRTIPTWAFWVVFGLLLWAAAAFPQTVHETGQHVWPFGQMRIGPLRFADLPFPCDSGTETYCFDCQQTDPCTGAGSGAWALCIATSWSCAAGASGGSGIVGLPPTQVNQLAVWNDLTATQLKGAADPADCPVVGQAAAGIDEFGVADGCFTPSGTFAPAGVDGDIQVKSGTVLGVYPGTGSCTNGIASLDSQGAETCVTTTTSTTTTIATTTTTTTTSTTTTTTLFIDASNIANRALVGWRQMGAAGVLTTNLPVGENCVGLRDVTSNGTETSDRNDGDGPWLNYPTAAAAASMVGHSVTGGPYVDTDRPDMSIETKSDLFYLIKTGPAATDIQNVRILIGVRSVNIQSTTVGDVENFINVGSLLFRYSEGASGAGDTTWHTISRGSDGVGGNVTIKDTAIAVAADTVYILRIDARDPASIKFYINGVLVTAHGGGGEFLPETDDLMIGQWKLHNLVDTGVTRNLKWRKYYLASGPWS